MGAEALQAGPYGVELAFYGGYRRLHELYLPTDAFPFFVRHPSLSALHDSAHIMYSDLMRSLACFASSALCAVIALASSWKQRELRPASGQVMAFCTLGVSTGWFVILVNLIPFTGEARGTLEVPSTIELPVVKDSFQMPVYYSRFKFADKIPLEKEVHVFMDVNGRLLDRGGSPVSVTQRLVELIPRLDIREGFDGLQRNHKSFFLGIDALAQPAEFLATLKSLRDAGIGYIRIVGRCAECSIRTSHGFLLAYPEQCRLTLERTEDGWTSDGVPANRVDPGPRDRENPWQRRVAVNLTRVNQWSEVTEQLELYSGLGYPIAILLPGPPPAEIEAPR